MKLAARRTHARGSNRHPRRDARFLPAEPTLRERSQGVPRVERGVFWGGGVSSTSVGSAHGLEPEAYLRDLIRVMPHWPRDRYLGLSPLRWIGTRAALDPDALAAEKAVLSPFRRPRELGVFASARTPTNHVPLRADAEGRAFLHRLPVFAQRGDEVREALHDTRNHDIRSKTTEQNRLQSFASSRPTLTTGSGATGKSVSFKMRPPSYLARTAIVTSTNFPKSSHCSLAPSIF